MQPKYTGDEMRDLAKVLEHPPLHPFALGKAASMLVWAADTLEAARVVIDEQRQGGK